MRDPNGENQITDNFPAHLKRYEPVPAPKVIPQRHKIQIIGDPKLAETISEELNGLGVTTTVFTKVKDLKSHTRGDEDGIIFCSPLVRSEVMSVFKGLQRYARFQGMTYFAIVPDWLNSDKERKMYKRGIHMIFEWPREQDTFKDLFQSVLDLNDVHVKADDSDKALENAINTRLQAYNQAIDPLIDISVYNGIAIVRGNLSSQGEKKELVSFINATPGVRGVVDQSLYVGANLLPGVVKKRAQTVLRDSDSIPDETLDVKVSPDEHVITLLGTTASVQTAERAVSQLEMFKGVRRVENRVNVSPSRHARDLNLAHRGQNILNKINLGSPQKVRLKVVNGDAYIRGQVSSSILLHQMEHAIRKLDGVQAVYNQIKIDHSVPIHFS